MDLSAAYIDNAVQILIGVGIVIVTSIIRFASPTEKIRSYLPPRPLTLYTSWEKYYGNTCAYAAFWVAAYFLLISYPELLNLLTQLDSDILSGARAHSPLVIAFVLSGAVTTNSRIPTFDTYVRRFFHKHAAIPEGAWKYGDQLYSNPMLLKDSEKQELLSSVESSYFSTDDFENPDGLKYKYLKIELFLQTLKKGTFPQSDPISKFVRKFKQECEALEEYKSEIRSRVEAYCDFDSLSPTELELKGLHKHIDSIKKEQSQQLTEYLWRVSEFIASAIIKSRGSDLEREELLRRFRIKIDSDPERLTWGDLATVVIWLFVLIYIGHFCISLWTALPFDWSDSRTLPAFGLMIREGLYWAVSGTMVQFLVIAIARWARNRRRSLVAGGGFMLDGKRRVHIYLFVFLSTFAIGGLFICAIIPLFATDFSLGGYPASLFDTIMKFKNWMWGLIPAVTAFCFVFTLDNEGKYPTTRLLEAGGQTVFTLVAALVIIFGWHSNMEGPVIAKVMVVSGLMGFFLGFFIPTRYRQNRATRQPDPG